MRNKMDAGFVNQITGAGFMSKISMDAGFVKTRRRFLQWKKKML